MPGPFFPFKPLFFSPLSRSGKALALDGGGVPVQLFFFWQKRRLSPVRVTPGDDQLVLIEKEVFSPSSHSFDG